MVPDPGPSCPFRRRLSCRTSPNSPYHLNPGEEPIPHTKVGDAPTFPGYI